MLDGMAQAGEDSESNSNVVEVVSLSQLPRNTGEYEPDVIPATLAETGSVLLHVHKIAVFTSHGDDICTLSCFGFKPASPVMELAREIGRVALAISEPIFLINISKRDSEIARRLADQGIESLVCVPETIDSMRSGIVVAMSDETRAFTTADVDIIRILASQACSQFVNETDNYEDDISTDNDVLIDLARRKIKELTALNKVSEAVSSTLDLEKLLGIALEQGMAAVSADGGSLMLINQDTNKLEIVSHRGLSDELVAQTSLPVGSGIAGYVAQTGDNVLVSDARKDSRFKMQIYRDELNSAASVPLKCRNQIIGVLNVNTSQPHRFFDERDIQLLSTVANQMAVAIENARLHERVIRRTVQLDSLLQISKTITSTLNMDEVLRRLSEEICRLFSMDAIVILFVDEQRGRFRYAYGSGLKTRRKHAYFDLAHPLAARVRHTGRRILTSDIAKQQGIYTEIADQESIHGAVAIPLKHSGRVIAVATAFSREVSSFPQSVKDLTRSLSDLAGVAIHNASAFGQKDKIAEMMQKRLIPQNLPVNDRIDIGIKFSPAKEVGGDYCDFITCGTDKIAVVLGDVSGNDVEAAEYTLMGKHVIRAYAKDCSDPADVLAKANSHIYQDTSPEVFISAFYGCLDTGRMTFKYSTAGCEPAVLYRSSVCEITNLKADGMLLGIIPNVDFEEKEVALISGDILVLVTDGLTEAGTNEIRFGIGRVGESVRQNADKPAHEIAESIYELALKWVAGGIDDDLGIVVLKVR